VVRGKGIVPDELVELPPGVLALSPAAAADLSEPELLGSEDVQLVRAVEVVREMVAHEQPADGLSVP
jgi:carboxyl-terminal processing protease